MNDGQADVARKALGQWLTARSGQPEHGYCRSPHCPSGKCQAYQEGHQAGYAAGYADASDVLLAGFTKALASRGGFSAEDYARELGPFRGHTRVACDHL